MIVTNEYAEPDTIQEKEWYECEQYAYQIQLACVSCCCFICHIGTGQEGNHESDAHEG